MNFAGIITSWFEAEMGGNLLLPDGWYGRPYDNQHSLTSIQEFEGTLTITLDQILSLRFEGLKRVTAQRLELTFSSFEKLFLWKAMGQTKGTAARNTIREK